MEVAQETKELPRIDPTFQTPFCYRCHKPLLGTVREDDGEYFCEQCVLVVMGNMRGCDE